MCQNINRHKEALKNPARNHNFTDGLPRNERERERSPLVGNDLWRCWWR